ncbi:oligosaccharide flippase family protein [Brevundimonas sp. PWP3-1b1]|uniref:oligosaccharide flippase family protein n=1 Tax=unclassified Brevundimonas TaxID=2622653 RepID=UPI003CF73FF7
MVGNGGHGVLSARGAADAGLLYGAHVARYVAPLLLYPVLTRRLGPEGFGVYAAAVALALIVSVVVDYGLTLSGPRDIAGAVEARDVIVGQALALRAVLVLPAVALGVGLAAIHPVLEGATPAVAMAILLGVGQGAGLLWFFQGVRDPAPLAVVEVGLALAATAVVLVWPALDVGGVLAVQAAGVWAGVVVGAVMLLRRQRVTAPGRGFVRRALIEGGPLFLSRAAVVAYTGAAVLVVAALAGPVQAAIYGVVDRMVAAAGSLMRPMAGLIAPRIAGLLVEDAETAFRTARWTLGLSLAAFVAIAGGLAVAAPILVPVLFGDGFGGAVDVLRLLAWMLPLVAVSQVLGLQVMTPLRMDRGFALTVGLGCVATLGPAVLLAPSLGANGMAWARIVGEAAVVAACLVWLRPHWASLFPRRIARVAA